MNIAELFVNLGIKGSEKTIGALTDVKKGLGETAKMSFEAKAGIVAAMYALERLFSASSAMGTGLMNFNALTGMSTRQLQQWQFAARQAGVSSEELTGSLKAVQTAMTAMLLGKGAPQGLGLVAQAVGFDIKKARDSFYVLEQLQKFAQKAPADVGNLALKSFGISEGTIAAMRRNAFTPQVMAQAPVYNDKEISALDRANVAWSNLGTKIEMAVGRFNARHGTQLVRDISHITDAVLKLADALEKVAVKFSLFEKLANYLEGAANTFKLIGEVFDRFEGKKSKEGDLLYTAPGGEAIPGLRDSPAGKFFRDLFDFSGKNKFQEQQPNRMLNIPLPVYPSDLKMSNFKMPVPQAASGSTQNINVNQNLNFQHDGKDPKQTSDSVKKANQDAFRQYTQGQES